MIDPCFFITSTFIVDARRKKDETWQGRNYFIKIGFKLLEIIYQENIFHLHYNFAPNLIHIRFKRYAHLLLL